MNIVALNSNFENLGSIEYINLQWNRKYYECGTFVIYIPADRYNNDTKYIYLKDRPELGIVNKMSLKRTIKGMFVQLEGFFYERMLYDKIVYPLFSQKGNLEDVATLMVKQYKDDIPKLNVSTSKSRGEEVAIKESASELGARLYDILKTQEYSYRTNYDYTTNSFIFEIWQGLDRTKDQSINNQYAFYDSDIDNITVINDDSDYKNQAVVVGNGEYEDGAQVSVVVGEDYNVPCIDIVKIVGKTLVSGSGTYEEPYLFSTTGNNNITFTNAGEAAVNAVDIGKLELYGYSNVFDSIEKKNGIYYSRKWFKKKRFNEEIVSISGYAYGQGEIEGKVGVHVTENSNDHNDANGVMLSSYSYSKHKYGDAIYDSAIFAESESSFYISLDFLRKYNSSLSSSSSEQQFLSAVKAFLKDKPFYIIYKCKKIQEVKLENQVVFSQLDVYNNMNNISCNYNTSGITIEFDNKKYSFTKSISIPASIFINYEKQLFVDEKSSHIEEGQTIDAFKEYLRQAGLEALREHVNINNVDLEIKANIDEYMKDYDLGDIVDIEIKTIGLSFKARIIEVYEVFKNNTHTIEIVLGDKIPRKRV